ncbi:MAG TPA: 4-hydroxy-tetrahydrodipicolinate reductase [Chitinophagaceae bacterium]|nr:4-hydroxy-tetrahydrodipicolinate reductase [Chitinophagaceae bacterium]
MLIALIGYGKMGKMIEEVAVQKGHNIILKIRSSNKEDLNSENLSKADVAIEFTNPKDAYENVKKCIDLGVPIVSGSTGWNTKLPDIEKYCSEKNGSFLHTNNFSIGVNIFFEINKHLARLMASQQEYDVIIKEIHHTEKKDAPSGTAVTLAEQVLEQLDRKKKWINRTTDDKAALEIISKRTDPAAGTHHVKYSSSIDDIELIHTAHNRIGFAWGAVRAAEYIHNKRGVFSMKEVLAL